MNRRHVLTGLGGLVMSGGAVLGSGAFSSVSADRSVEVNVTNDAGQIATDIVDVRADVGGNSSVYARNGSQSTLDSASATDFDPSGDQVSLIVNSDPTLIFGDPDGGLLSNATTKYTNLFSVVNNDDGSSTDFDVTFELTNAPNGWLTLTDANGNSIYGTAQTVTAGTVSTFNAEVTTLDGTSNTPDADATLNITIEQA